MILLLISGRGITNCGGEGGSNVSLAFLSLLSAPVAASEQEIFCVDEAVGSCRCGSSWGPGSCSVP